MVVTVHDLRSKADQLLDALDVYDQFVKEWPYEPGEVPDRIEGYLAELDSDTSGSGSSPEVTFATEVKRLYYEACEAEATYLQQARERGQPEWSQIVTEVEPVRKAARGVHTAGYEIDSETDELDYRLPRELCPAHLVSMNGGSSPIIYEDRVTQYQAVADCFSLSPEIVYHPGSGHDVSPSETFTESRVVYADIDEAAMTHLKRAGYEAVGTDATKYELETDADVIIFRNAGLLEEAIVAGNLQSGGWVLANDHLESAQHLARMDSLKLVGVVPDVWTGSSAPVETRNLGAYLSQLDPDQEHSKQFREPAQKPVDSAGQSCTSPAAIEEEDEKEATLGDTRNALNPGRTTGGSESGVPTTKGTPLDLYIFRDVS
ncbi:hypothetical protein [Halobaculum sp. EA56]|uniref:hypothetical protein n=1 Tax=Halobaculum sp. EA56 TaxID=3421648 RepID=UPI003EBE977A